MDQQQKINKAFEDMQLAAAMRIEADKIDYKAKKQLEELVSTAGLPLKSKKADQGIISAAISKRMRTAVGK